MSDFPKWLLALAFTNLIPLIICPLFLFGGIRPFGTTDYAVINFLLYLLVQLLWIVPCGLFFLGLHLWRNCFELPAIVLVALGFLMTIADIILLFNV
jgi:hypothetical protein